MTTVHHRYGTVRGRQVFYRPAEPAQAPAVVLLHGFPTSSFESQLDAATGTLRDFLGRTLA
jgi:pimeloyl-ACP methyl ester carboxylesterase